MERFWKKVRKTDTCWIWIASKNKCGYGTFKFLGKSQLAHRISYSLTGSTIPKDLEFDHLCRNRSCVNPAHLELVTHKENILRGNSPSAIHARQTHCHQGHPLSGTNIRIDSLGRRKCLECRKLSAN